MKLVSFTAQKRKFFMKDFCSLCDQIRRKVPPEKVFLLDVWKETRSMEWVNKALDFTTIKNTCFLKLFKILRSSMLKRTLIWLLLDLIYVWWKDPEDYIFKLPSMNKCQRKICSSARVVCCRREDVMSPLQYIFWKQ